MPLSEEEQQKHIDAAQGFMELGMFLDADGELERIDPFCRHLPEVLEVRVQIYSALKKWELVEVVAKKLADYDPEDRGLLKGRHPDHSTSGHFVIRGPAW